MITNTLTDERLLLDKAAEGDQKAFTLLFDAYFQQMGTHVMRLTRSRQIAEDIVQDVFLKIWIARESLKEVRNFRAFLFITSKNQTINVMKRLAWEARKTDELVSREKLWDKTQDETEHTRQVKLIEEQYYSLLDEAIAQLPDQQRKVFTLSRKERKKYEEIAQDMNLSRETVKKYLQHATRSISEYVRENMDPTLVVLLLLTEYQLHQQPVFA